MELLDRLGLADARTIRAMEGRMRRLGRELPQFQSSWVDGLLQARRLTPYQAAEIHAGRGWGLRIGSFVIVTKRSSLGYGQRFAARRAESGEANELVVMEGPAGGQDRAKLDTLAALAARGADLAGAGLVPVIECGCEGRRIWAAMRAAGGQTAAEQVVRHGRMPPSMVLEIARQMVAALGQLERAGLAHGDVSARSLALTEKGQVLLLAPGLRPIVRPAEGFAYTDLAPEYYDSLAPEQIEGGTAADRATDLYGCGCLWWHLLAGRPCFAGGDSLGKLRAHLMEEPVDVRSLAPDAPADLAGIIGRCLIRDPRQRPESACDLARQLGPPTPAGRAEVARWARPSAGSPPIHVPSQRKPKAPAGWPAAAIGTALVGFVAVLWAIGLPSKPGRDAPQGAAAPMSHDAGRQPSTAGPRDLAPLRVATDSPAGRSELVLPAGQPVTLDSSRIADGMRVTGPPGSRATVIVAGSPLVVSREDVLFDGLDFLWRPGPAEPTGGELPAMIRAEAGKLRFQQCTFRVEEEQAGGCAAIEWVFPVDRSGLGLPSGRVALSDCVLIQVATAVDARTAAALVIECNNVLYLGPGPLLRLDHAPRVDQPLDLALKNVTLRQASCVLEIHDLGAAEKSGAISVTAQLCVFAPRASGALLSFVGPAVPAGLAKSISWTGQGALVTPEATIAQWTDGAGKTAELNDEAFSIAGLVRSPVEFAGAAEPVVLSNAAQRWQAPLPTADPPGIRAGSLPVPPVPFR